MPRAGKTMSWNRFNQIKRYLHYCDETTAITDRTVANYDRLYKVRFLLNAMKAKCMALYSPSEDISVDECMIPYRGRWSGKMYDSSKPIKWGVKVWMACDAANGYLYNFDVYSGRDRDFDNLANVNMTTAVVLKLAESLWNRGYHIYTDRYYTSPQLLYLLGKLGLSGSGTCMTNRKGFPKQLVKTKAEARKLTQGQFEWVQCQKTGLVATRWMDKKAIYFLSNGLMPEASTPVTVTRVTKIGEKKEVAATPVVVQYNRMMGGVDLNDKMAKLDKSRKSYKWYTRIDRKCFQWGLYNAYVLYKLCNDRPMEFRNFSLEVLTALVGEKKFCRIQKPCTMPDEPRFTRGELHAPLWPQDGSTNHRCVVCEKKFHRERAAKPTCKYADMEHKSVKTSIQCSVCKVYLCVKRGSTCWVDYHSKVQFWL